jgi:23S rRNA pseudouridine2605 synthase
MPIRLNRFIASATTLSRRAADQAIADGRVLVNKLTPSTGQAVESNDDVTLDGRSLTPPPSIVTVMLNKPVGYVVSRNGQGSHTIYELLPYEFQTLNPVGRLDKESSGLLLLSNDGELAQQLTHPSYEKLKTYEVTLGQPLAPLHRQMISDHGLMLEDGLSKLQLEQLQTEKNWRIQMHEGRNRQIRRTFESLNYRVIKLHRTQFGTYDLGGLRSAAYRLV